jgi:hypothetical protein
MKTTRFTYKDIDKAAAMLKKGVSSLSDGNRLGLAVVYDSNRPSMRWYPSRNGDRTNHSH